MARNQAPMPEIEIDWNMLWAKTEVTCDRFPPAVASPLEMITFPSENPHAASTRTPNRNQ